MIVFANLLAGIAFLLSAVLNFMFFVIIGRIIISWVNADPYNWLVQTIMALTEPPLRFIKRHIKTTVGAFDFAPFILLLFLQFLQLVLVQSLYHYSYQFMRVS